MCNGSSAVTISADATRRRKSVARENRALVAVPAERADATASTVAWVDLSPVRGTRRPEWALVIQPPGPRVPTPASPGPARPSASSMPRRLALVRVPELADGLGQAVLLHRRGQTRICCLENHITDRAACVLSALAGQALLAILGGDADGSVTDPEPRITVTRIGHSLRPADHRHVASADERSAPGALFVCSNLVSAELAGILGLLYTAYARALLDLGQPCAEILAANDR